MGDSRRRGETASVARVAGVQPPGAVKAFDDQFGLRETESLCRAGVSRKCQTSPGRSDSALCVCVAQVTRPLRTAAGIVDPLAKRPRQPFLPGLPRAERVGDANGLDRVSRGYAFVQVRT